MNCMLKMPYYCTVPRCTSMAGKAKNVSFHQFPRDEELAKLWNNILKRGKPYTKYSKVCSLHFRPEDYTITSVGKNKGQWRTLRKDAIPSLNLPDEGPSTPHRRSSGAWLPSGMPSVVDPQVQHQMAQAIYLQTMLAMQVSTNGTLPIQNYDPPPYNNIRNPINCITTSEIEKLLLKNDTKRNSEEKSNQNQLSRDFKVQDSDKMRTSFKCDICTKCFKDPDVFVLHKRTHNKEVDAEVKQKVEDEDQNTKEDKQEKENFNTNRFSSEETLRANPILANLLKSGVPNRIPEVSTAYDTQNMFSLENQIMSAIAANIDSYMRNISANIPNELNENENTYDSNDTRLNENELDHNEGSDSNDQRLNNDQNTLEDNFEGWKVNNYDNKEVKTNDFELKDNQKYIDNTDNHKTESISENNEFANSHSSKSCDINIDTKFKETYEKLFDYDTEIKSNNVKNNVLDYSEENFNSASINAENSLQNDNVHVSKDDIFFKTAVDFTKSLESHRNDDFSCTSSEVT